MANNEEEIPWEGQRSEAAYAFGVRCRHLLETYPYHNDQRAQPVLQQIIVDLVTELWDQGFSQTEISTAFNGALATLPQYAGGEDRRGDKVAIDKPVA